MLVFLSLFIKMSSYFFGKNANEVYFWSGWHEGWAPLLQIWLLSYFLRHSIPLRSWSLGLSSCDLGLRRLDMCEWNGWTVQIHSLKDQWVKHSFFIFYWLRYWFTTWLQLSLPCLLQVLPHPSPLPKASSLSPQRRWTPPMDITHLSHAKLQ